jgi:hypothetical protein
LAIPSLAGEVYIDLYVEILTAALDGIPTRSTTVLSLVRAA